MPPPLPCRFAPLRTCLHEQTLEYEDIGMLPLADIRVSVGAPRY